MNCYASLLLFCMLFATCTYAKVITHEDMITGIPGLKQMPKGFNMYSGFLTAGRDHKKVFYWLNEANDLDNKVLLVWLNGGPGCSSLQGLFKENGPFTFNEETEKLEPNPFSWNRFAHTLYLEAPFNTGFSHFANDEKPTSNDHNVASNLLKTLENLMEEHPRYRTYDIFLAGQSYAGIYIPTLAVRITELNSTLAANFKGIILGNPLLSEYLNEKTRATFAYTHGYIGDETYTTIQKYDCYNGTATASYNYSIQNECTFKRWDVSSKLLNQAMNFYNIGEQCWRKKADDYDYEDYDDDDSQDEDEIKDELLSDLEDEEDESEIEAPEEPEQTKLLKTCEHKSPGLEKFLSRVDVQTAIHAGDRGAWKMCSSKVFLSHGKRYKDMTTRIQKLVDQHKKSVLLYYGDLDLACNVYGGREFVRGLGFKDTVDVWPINVVDGKMESLAGYAHQYHKLLAFAVVKGAGHSAPTDKPAECYSLVNQWIQHNI